MGINAATAQTFIIRATQYNTPAGTALYLHDKYMGVYKQLLQGEEYKFDITTDANSQGNERFELRMGDVTSTETVTGATSFAMNVTPNPATASISIAYNAQTAGNTNVRITNMVGQQVYATSLGYQQNGNLTVPVQSFATGMYIVELYCGDKKSTQRFVKQ